MGTDVRDLDAGELIDGRFQIQAKIGDGNQGVVYRVLDLKRDRICALKLLCADERDEDSRARFRREARLGANLRHRNLVEVFEADKLWRGQLYMVMELLEGVESLIQHWPKLDWPGFLAIAEQVAAALDYLAEYELVHRDLAPSNVLIDRKGRVKVIDLGIAREAGSGLTRSSMVNIMGSAGYMPPEQIERPKTVEPASDQWALAAIAYEALTGIPPHFDEPDHEDGQEMSALQRVANGTPIRHPRESNPSVPASLGATVMRALSATPAGRFRGAIEFVAQLRRAPAAGLRLPLMRLP